MKKETVIAIGVVLIGLLIIFYPMIEKHWQKFLHEKEICQYNSREISELDSNAYWG